MCKFKLEHMLGDRLAFLIVLHVLSSAMETAILSRKIYTRPKFLSVAEGAHDKHSPSSPPPLLSIGVLNILRWLTLFIFYKDQQKKSQAGK